MKYTQLGEKILFRLDKDEELVQTLKHICNQLHIKAGTVTGIGATDKATIGLFNTKTKQYQSKELVGDHEITSIMGNISTMDTDISLHLHANLCNEDHAVVGGHLVSAVISATFEGVVEIINTEFKRSFNEKTGLNLLEIH